METLSAIPDVALRKAVKRLAENRIVLSAKYSRLSAEYCDGLRTPDSGHGAADGALSAALWRFSLL